MPTIGEWEGPYTCTKCKIRSLFQEDIHKHKVLSKMPQEISLSDLL